MRSNITIFLAARLRVIAAVDLELYELLFVGKVFLFLGNTSISFRKPFLSYFFISGSQFPP
jgi:hypothetical protein